MTNLERWMETYTRNLLNSVRRSPNVYTYPESDVPKVVERMREAFIKGSFNKEGLAVSLTCKELGVKYTYAGIKAYLKDGSGG